MPSLGKSCIASSNVAFKMQMLTLANKTVNQDQLVVSSLLSENERGERERKSNT
jgi:hypothetical protein